MTDRNPFDLTRRRALAGALATPAALSLAACGEAPQTSAQAGTRSTLHYGFALAWRDPSPVMAVGNTMNFVGWDSLTRVYPGDAEARPWLATSWQHVTPTEMVMELRDDAAFSDGKPLTAADVIFSWQKAMQTGPSTARVLSNIADIQSLGDDRIKVTTRLPDPILAKRLSVLFVIGAHNWDDYEAGRATSPIGSGPWKLLAYDRPGGVMEWDTNPYSWTGGPATPELVMHGFSGQRPCQTALEAGQLDIAGMLEPIAAQLLEDRFVTERVRVGSTSILTLNTRVPPFDDIRVRRALNHAIDPVIIVKTIMRGAGDTEGGQQIPSPDVYGYDPDFDRAYEYSPAKARALLAEAGYPDGFKTSLASWARDVPVLEAVAGFLREVGIEAKIDIMQPGEWFQAFSQGTERPIFMKGINSTPLFDVVQPYELQTWPPKGMPGGYKSWDDPEWDAMLAKSQTLFDPAERLALLQKMGRHIHDQAPIGFMFRQKWVYAWRREVSGFDPSTGFFVHLDKVRLGGAA